jgi:hypothetical protein
MSYELTFKDFETSESFTTSLKSKIESLLDISPSDAGVHSCITKIKDGYSGVLKIVSSQGKFAVEAAAQDLDGLMKTLFQLMSGQVRSWQSRRFLPEN